MKYVTLMMLWALFAPAKLISIDEAADRLGTCRTTIRRYITKGQINAVRVGHRLIRIDEAELDRFVSIPVGTETFPIHQPPPNPGGTIGKVR